MSARGVLPVAWVLRGRAIPVAVIGVYLLFAAACSGVDVAALPSPRGSYEEGTVTGVLAADGRFGVLVALFEAATVSQGPPGARDVHGNAAEAAGRPGWDHTVFAPTDDAFSQLNQDTVNCMFDGSNATESVRIHVVPELLPADSFPAGQVTTIAGPVTLQVEGERVSFAGAEIVEFDVEATNGVIHVIDEVNVPAICKG